MTFVECVPLQKRLTWRLALIATWMPLASVCPDAYQLIEDASGWVAPVGYTVMEPPPTVDVMVTLTAMAVAPAGTRFAASTLPLLLMPLATDTVRVWPPVRTDECRESYTRCGVIAWKAPAAAGPPSLRQVPGLPATMHSQSPSAAETTSPRAYVPVVGFVAQPVAVSRSATDPVTPGTLIALPPGVPFTSNVVWVVFVPSRVMRMLDRPVVTDGASSVLVLP